MSLLLGPSLRMRSGAKNRPPVFLDKNHSGTTPGDAETKALRQGTLKLDRVIEQRLEDPF